MESDRINFLLSNPSEATLVDAQHLQQQVEKFPYSQILHILLARIKYHENTKDKNTKLTTAAIYSSERSVLKRAILEPGYLEHGEEIVPFQELQIFDLEEVTAEEPVLFGENETSSIFDEVLKNLEKLKSLRKQFKFLELEEEPEVPSKTFTTKEKTVEKKKKNTDSDSVSKKSRSSKKTEHKKKKLDKILEKDEVLDTQVNAYYLKEMEEKKVTLETEEPAHHHDQLEIIEKFIVEQPTIRAKSQDHEVDQDLINKDLSEKSTKFGDDLISENLAVILLKQGKKGRAIDIYKRLIWKLPQKKAYFAARIEEIKK